MLSVILMQTASGSEQCPSEAAGETWSPQCFDVINETRRLKQEFVSKVKFDPHGFAAISIGQPIELAIVNRRGEIVIPHIRHTGDFDYPDAPSRIGRFAVEYNKANGEPASKCGYFSLDSYQIIVPAQFDHCQAFKKEETYACKECASYCNSEDCQNSTYVGGTRFVIGRNGAITREIRLPGLDQICSANRSAKVIDYRQCLAVLQCVDIHQ